MTTIHIVIFQNYNQTIKSTKLIIWRKKTTDYILYSSQNITKMTSQSYF